MNRFFLPEDSARAASVVEAEVAVAGEDALHIARVLRLGPGERIVLVVAPDREALAEIVSADAKSVRTRIVALREVRREAPVRIRLAQGVAKGERMDYIVQKATEIGVAEIVPVVTERSIVRLDRERGEDRVKRWQKIAREAAQQSGRTVVPPVLQPVSFAAALPRAGADAEDLNLIPYEGESGRGLYETVTGRCQTGRVETITVYIGPEGGFADNEVAAAIAAGCLPVSLGPRILRTETAGPAAIAMLLYHLGDLGRAVAAAGPWEE